ncbi:MAG: AbgT family transporter [Thermoleophilia bacterium]|nr:AbgT family transporter [Thermoleophilia bacterium]
MSADETKPRSTRRGLGARLLGAIERAGNRVPHPAILFLALIVGVIGVSQVLAWLDVSASYEVAVPIEAPQQPHDTDGSILGGAYEEPAIGYDEVYPDEYEIVEQKAEAQGLLDGDGIRFLFTSFVTNFMNFTAMGIILIVMIGVGVAEASGLIGALIRKLVRSASGALLTYLIVFVGVISSIASDAGYLVLIPLGGAAFYSVGRHPLAGIAAAFAGVAGGFGVNLLITPTDAVLTEIANESIDLAGGTPIDLTANLYFGIVSTVLITVLGGLLTSRIVEPRLGAYDESDAPDGGPGSIGDASANVEDIDPQDESRGLRRSGVFTLLAIVGIALLSLPPGAPLRDPDTGDLIGHSPFMSSLVVLIAIVFFAAGLGFGRGAGTLRTSNEVIDAITKSWAALAGLLLLFLLIAQFIAYFNYSNMATIAAVRLGDLLEQGNLSTPVLLVLVVLMTAVVNIIMPQAIAKWALLAPILIPLFARLDVDPEIVLAAYRVGDSPTNIVTPIMAYFPLIVVFAARWQRSAGIGTVMAMMIPYSIAFTIGWTVLLVGWQVVGLPFGPG